MSPNLNEQCNKNNILTNFRNDVTQCKIIPIIVTLTAFDLIYSKFSEQSSTHCNNSNSIY